MKSAIIIYIILALLVMVGFEANAYEKNHNCEKHPIYCQIITNRPTIKRSYAFELSNIIYEKTRKYKIDPTIFTAILAQESMYKVSAKNCTTGIIESESYIKKSVVFMAFKQCMQVGDVGSEKFVKCVNDKHEYTKVSVCTDFGIGQIWYKTANSYEFDIERLTNDLEYSVEAAAIVLEQFKNRYAHKEEDWWTRYNASNKNARNTYKALINGFIDAQ